MPVLMNENVIKKKTRGLIANMDSSLGESGAWFVFALIPLIIIPFAIAMVALLTPKLLKQRALKDNAIRMMAQVSIY